MADSKSQYSTNVSRVKKAAESNKALNKKLNEGKSRAAKHQGNWQSVNINDVIDKYAPGANHYISNGKVIFSNGGRYNIVADVAGGYLRIQDTYCKGRVYITLDGRHREDFTSDKEFKKHSHYRILKRGE